MSLHDQLRELDGLDRQLRGLKARSESAQRRHTAQAGKLQQLQQQHKELDEEVKATRAHAHTLEKQSQDLDDQVEKLRTQMNSVRNNKEYSALSIEVSNAKIDKGKLEDQALEQMSRVDELLVRQGELAAKVESQQKLVNASKKEVDEARAEAGDRLEAAQRERDALAASIDDEPLAEYEKLAHENEGEAMAQVEEQDRKRREYTCGGCYMTLPVERVNALMRGQDRIVTCASCGRILYLGNELRSGIGSKG